MRLRDYQDLINKAIPIINAVEIVLNTNAVNNSLYAIKKIQPFQKILEELKNAEIEVDLINKILAIPNFKNNIESEIIVNQNTKNNFDSYKNSLSKALSNLQLLLKNVLNEENPNNLNIKLPDEYSSIKDYVTFFTELESICYPFSYVQQEITIVNFDVGSKWIGIEFPDSISAGFFLSLASKSADLFNKILESRKLISDIQKNKAEQTAANIKAINTTIDIINKNQKAELEKYKEKLIKEAITESRFILKEGVNENEFDNFVRIALEKLGGLLLKGMEIVPALNAKTEIKQLSQKATANIEEKRKLIIGCDNLKYITVQNSNINSKDIPSDTIEISE